MKKTVKELMAVKLIPEILDEARAASSEEEVATILYKNNSPALRMMIAWAMAPGVEFDVEVPGWKHDPNPIGLSPNSLFIEARRMYIFSKYKNIPAEKKKQILLNILESVHPTEAQVVLDVLHRNLRIPYLTERAVNMAFPGLLPVLAEPARHDTNNY